MNVLLCMRNDAGDTLLTSETFACSVCKFVSKTREAVFLLLQHVHAVSSRSRKVATKSLTAKVRQERWS